MLRLSAASPAFPHEHAASFCGWGATTMETCDFVCIHKIHIILDMAECRRRQRRKIQPAARQAGRRSVWTPNIRGSGHSPRTRFSLGRSNIYYVPSLYTDYARHQVSHVHAFGCVGSSIGIPLTDLDRE